MAPRSSVLLLIPHLGGGGAERVIELLAQGLSSQKYDLHLGLLTCCTASTLPLPTHVTVHALGVLRVRYAAIPLLRLVWRLKPRLVLSGIAHLNFLVLLLQPFYPRRTALVARQSGALSSGRNGGASLTARLFYRLLYRFAARVLCQSPAMARELVQHCGVAPARAVVLPNPVDIAAIRAALQQGRNSWSGPGPHLLAVGRLSREKGLDLLLRALAAVRVRFPAADLTLAGTGKEESALRALAGSLGLPHAVRFTGYLAPPWPLYSGATLFVLSSRHEAMPNALLEAAAARLPLVTTPASQGLVDLLQNQPGVWLAADVSTEALTAALLAALDALQPGQRFSHGFVAPFQLESALAAYEAVLDAVLEERP